MKKPILLLYMLYFSVQVMAQEKASIKKKELFAIGESVEFYSPVLKQNRQINVYLPSSYANDLQKKYPVIYLLDGSADEDFVHVAGLVQFGSFSWINMLPESIVVGIANVDRKHDFTYPTKNKKDKQDFPTTGSSARFITFLEKELQPFVNQNYRTASTSTLVGQSLGGLLATEILFKKPDLFDNYIIVSPSLWWDDESLLTYKPKVYASNKAVYIAVGKEGPIMERVAEELYQKLKQTSKGNTRVYYNFLKEQDHGDALHLAVYDAFEKIFRQEEK